MGSLFRRTGVSSVAQLACAVWHGDRARAASRPYCLELSHIASGTRKDEKAVKFEKGTHGAADDPVAFAFDHAAQM